MRTVALGIYTLLLALSLGWSPLVRADAVTDWNVNAGKAALAACISPNLDPLHESRMYAMMHVAIHDALNAIQRNSRPYALDLQAPPGASPEAAVATAAHDVLVPLLTQLSFPQEGVTGCARKSHAASGNSITSSGLLGSTSARYGYNRWVSCAMRYRMKSSQSPLR
jgi:hypothetical protein